MKSLFLATAAVAAFAAAPAFAQQAAGSVGVSYSNASVDLGSADADADSYALDGIVAVPAFAGWTATFAGKVAHNDDFDDTAVAGTAHLTTLAGSDLRFGGFVGASDLGDETAWTGGAEVQKYLANATLTGTLSYTNADDIDVDAWTVGGDAAFYPMENLRLNAGVSYSSVDAGSSADLWTYGVGAEYQLASTPFSVVGGFTRGDIEDVTIDTWTVGLRYSFGGGLQARDRAGAALPGSSIANILGAL